MGPEPGPSLGGEFGSGGSQLARRPAGQVQGRAGLCAGASCWPLASPPTWGNTRAILAKASGQALPPLLTTAPDVSRSLCFPARSVLSPSCVPSSPRQAPTPGHRGQGSQPPGGAPCGQGGGVDTAASSQGNPKDQMPGRAVERPHGTPGTDVGTEAHRARGGGCCLRASALGPERCSRRLPA